MIVVYPFGTIKRAWGISYFQAKDLKSVKTEVSLVFWAYNMRRVMNIIGVKEMIKRLESYYAFLISLNYILTFIG